MRMAGVSVLAGVRRLVAGAGLAGLALLMFGVSGAGQAAAAPAPTGIHYTLTLQGMAPMNFSRAQIVRPVSLPLATGPARPQTPKPVEVILAGSGQRDLNELFQWHAAAVAGQPGARRDGTLRLVEGDGQTLMTWKLFGAWMSKIELSGTSSAGAPRVTVTLVVNQIELQ